MKVRTPSLSLMIPMLLLACGLVAATLSVVDEVVEADARVEAEGRRSALLIGGVLAGEIEALYRAGLPETLGHRTVARAMSDRNVDVAAVFDEQGRVAHATRLSLIGEPFANTPFARWQTLLELAERQRTAQVGEDGGRLVLAVPLDMAPNVHQSLRPQTGVLALLYDLTSLRHAAYASILTSAGRTCALLALVSLLAWFGLHRLVTSRLVRIVRQVERIGAGESPRPLAPDGEDEVARIAQAIDTMAAQVDERSRSLKTSEGRLKDALAAQTAARTEAEAANRAKDEFLMILSHELRTPLQPILGWVKLLLDEEAQVDRGKGLKTIERNAEALLAILSDLLDMSAILKGKLHLEVTSIDFGALTAEVAEGFQLAAANKGVKLTTSSDGQLHTVNGDRDRLRQVIWNLLSNALKFTPRGGHVEARVERAGSCVRLRVLDDGEGLSPGTLDMIFERFRQGDGTTTRTRGGLGLGLSIVKDLVTLHGGRVEAASDGPGKGALFTVVLPVANVALVPGQPMVATPPGLRLARLRDLKVLVVDDSRDGLDMVSLVLRAHGCRLTTATDVESAVRAYDSDKPDVIITDIGMPGGDGFDLFSAIRRREDGLSRKTPVMALTAYSRPEDRRRILDAGFQRYVPKPITPSALVKEVVELAGNG